MSFSSSLPWVQDTMANLKVTSSPIISPDAQYGYVPTLWICCTFVALFSITTVLHLAEALYFSPGFYWLIPTMALCGVGEIIGWSGRLWSSQNPINGTAYLMQISTTIIAPVFLTAALYTILGLIINILGFQYSRLKPKTYLKTFLSLDVLALVVQAVGGGMASVAHTDSGAALGAHVMLAGIFLQLVGLLLYMILAIEFLLRFHLQNPFTDVIQVPLPGSPTSWNSGTAEKGLASANTRVVDGRGTMPPRIGLMVIGMALATGFVFVRTIYRTIELLGGWRGYIIRTEIFFNVLDATPIIIALFILNLFNPGLLLREGRTMSR